MRTTEIPDERAVVRPPHAEEGGDSHAALLNKLRAAVLGANDGIISTAGLVMGVAGATTNSAALATAGIAGLVAGALSMAAGEYVSVSAQRDSERALLAKERHELATMPEEELDELAGLLRERGLSADVAHRAAEQMMAHDALGAHADLELGIDQHDLVSPWAAAVSSLFSFAVGALIPLLAMVLAPADVRVGVTVGSVLVALFLTGFASARVGGAPPARAIARNIVGGFLAMAVTFGIGTLVGTQLG
ncbi:VIT1/CCC1 transporter family protein [Propioniciclava coleopterorum]|uniref:VIT1/CCC1 transporter family protein n=1 Tax=Propioniciclava coleopterorum TaxID=2714937 RepID=UPI001FE64A76|nr:VIT family protein [Propioniciclava coleopterorum]